MCFILGKVVKLHFWKVYIEKPLFSSMVKGKIMTSPTFHIFISGNVRITLHGIRDCTGVIK
jgi:hypothetical protein